MGIQGGRHCCHSHVQAVHARTGLGCPHQTGRQVDQAAAVLMLVPVLTPGSRPRVVFDPEILFGSLAVWVVFHGSCAAEHGDGYRRRVDAAMPIIARDPLDTVPAALLIECLDPFALHLDGDQGVAGARVRRGYRASFSRSPLGKPHVCGRQFRGEHASVYSALTGADFDSTF
jgi:hypothetical protein